MPRQFTRAIVGAAALALGLSGAVVVASPAAAAEFTVTEPGDDVNTEHTLRWAVKQAEDTAGDDVIVIAAGLTVTLQSQLELTEGVTFIGGAGTTITREADVHMIAINPNAAKTDQDYMFDGIVFDGGGRVGRAILATSGTPFASLTTEDAAFDGFFAPGSGGAIAAVIASGNGPVALHRTDFTQNGSLLGGGAVYVSGAASFSMTGPSEVDGNSSTVGGALVVDKVTSATIEGVTFTSNAASDGNGGALLAQRSTSLAITDSTFGGDGTGNTAHASGGAILAAEVTDVTLTRVTAIGNSSGPDGGGGAVHVETAANATVDGGWYQDNEATAGDGGAVRVYNVTGAVSVEGGAQFEGNRALNAGGAVSASEIGTFATQDATFRDNEAGWSGGAIWLDDSFATFLAERTVFDQNSALDGNGGGIGVAGMPAGDHSVTLRASTFSGNSAAGSSAYGGAFVIGETGDGTVVSVDSSTFVDNSVTESDGTAQGAAIAALDPNSVNGRLDIVNSTIVERISEDSPYAVFVQHVGETGLLSLRNTTLLGLGGVLVVQNDGAAEFVNSIVETADLPGAGLDGGDAFEARYSLFSSEYEPAVIADAATNRFGIADMRLGVLQDNGGPTETRLPASDSPAVNTGNAAVESDLPQFDQRGPGYLRVQSGALDIGAVELPAPPLPATGGSTGAWLPGALLLLMLGAGAIAAARVRSRGEASSR